MNFKKIKNKKIIITGSTGQIGSLLISDLYKNNSILKIHKSYSNFMKNDYNYNQLTYDLLNNFKPDYVLLLGSPTDKKKVIKKEYQIWFRNKKKLLNILLNIKSIKVLINFGSAKEFVKNTNKESNYYNLYKSKFTNYLNSLKEKTKFKIFTLHLSSVYGENINSGIIHNFSRKIIKNKNIHIKNINNVRNFIYYNDLLKILFILLNQSKKYSNYNYLILSNRTDTLFNFLYPQFTKYKKSNNLKCSSKTKDGLSIFLINIKLPKNTIIFKLNKYANFKTVFKKIINSNK